MGRFLVGAIGLTVGLTLFAGPVAGAAPAGRSPSVVSAAAQSTDVAGKAAASERSAPVQAQPKSKAQQPVAKNKTKKKKKKKSFAKKYGVALAVIIVVLLVIVIAILLLRRRGNSQS